MPLGFFKKLKPSNKSLSTPFTVSLTDKEKKNLFGLKIVQAQQNPEPVYDLSSCCAQTLPDDTYTFCKILGKTKLIIKENCLTSLETGGSLQDLSELRILDASYNSFEKLPNDIHLLKNLRILNMSHNKLKSLPESFSHLAYLEELYLSNNKFTKVPQGICALPKLQVLSLKGNKIISIPEEICSLHQSLKVLELDFDIIKFPSQDIVKNGLIGIMTYFCELQGIEYTGPGNCSEDNTDSSVALQKNEYSSPPVDDIMIEYMRKKQEQLKAQIFEEEKLRALEQEQLHSVLHNASKSKEELLHELSSSPFEMSDYELRKQDKVLEQMKLEEKFRSEQDEQLDQYLTYSTNKDSLLLDISNQEENLQQEVEAIVAAKEAERSRLLEDLSKSERATDSAVQELMTLQQNQKSQDFVNLVKEQDEELKNVLLGIVDTTNSVRRADVLKAMQNSLLEVAIAEAERDKIEEKQKSWVSALIKEGEVEEKQIQQLLHEKASVQEEFLNDVLREEEFQAEAFKLLLWKMDLKRNSVIRQIALVEYELKRLSSLELRKKRFGVQNGSSTMLHQRNTLVSLLKSLLEAKEERDEELDSFVSDLYENKDSSLTSEDFWLLQYQKLMTLKPFGIVEAEQELDPKVHKILTMACALDLLPLFAKERVTFDKLLEMSEEEFASLNIGTATFSSIQRALHSYLVETKIGSQEASAPLDDSDLPSAPLEDNLERDLPSAPLPDVQYIETECVVCLSSDCRVLFIPCGHVCVCTVCCQTLLICPLCRADIGTKCFIDGQ